MDQSGLPESYCWGKAALASARRLRTSQAHSGIWHVNGAQTIHVATQLGWRRCLVEDASSIDQPSPFHVVEEEGLRILCLESNRPTQVESESVVAKLWLFRVRHLFGQVRVSIQSIIAVVLPCTAMELLRAALDGHAGHAAGRVSLVGRIVARCNGEFLERILRG